MAGAQHRDVQKLVFKFANKTAHQLVAESFDENRTELKERLQALDELQGPDAMAAYLRLQNVSRLVPSLNVNETVAFGLMHPNSGALRSPVGRNYGLGT